MKPSLFWGALIPAMTLPFLASFFYFVVFTESPFAKIIYSGTKFFTLVWPLICFYFLFRKQRPSLHLTSSHHFKAIPLGILLGVVIVLLIFGLVQTSFGKTLLENAREPIHQKAQSFGILEHYWLFAIFLSVLHSLLEEYYWRWFVFGQLRERLKPYLAHLLAGIAFASHHIVVTTQFFPLATGIVLGASVGIGGILWSLLYEKQKTLMGAWISHLIVDFGIMAVGHYLLFGTYF